MFFGVVLCFALRRFLETPAGAVWAGIKVAEIESVKAVFAGLVK